MVKSLFFSINPNKLKQSVLKFFDSIFPNISFNLLTLIYPK